MARYCCYCGALFVSDASKCDTCGRTIIRQPTVREGIESDESDGDGEEFTKVADNRLPIDLSAPPDHQEMIYGYVERYRGERVHTFHFFREADGSFIMAASMAASKEGPVFFHTRSDLNGVSVRMSQIPRRKGHNGFLAALIPTAWLGTEFVVTTK